MSLIDVLFLLINPKLLDNFGGEIPYHSTKTNREVLMAALNPGAQRDQEAVWCRLSSKLTAKCRSPSPERQPSNSLISGRLVIHNIIFFEYAQTHLIEFHHFHSTWLESFKEIPCFIPSPKTSRLIPFAILEVSFGVLRGFQHKPNPIRNMFHVGPFRTIPRFMSMHVQPQVFQVQCSALSVFCFWDSLSEVFKPKPFRTFSWTQAWWTWSFFPTTCSQCGRGPPLQWQLHVPRRQVAKCRTKWQHHGHFWQFRTSKATISISAGQPWDHSLGASPAFKAVTIALAWACQRLWARFQGNWLPGVSTPWPFM